MLWSNYRIPAHFKYSVLNYSNILAVNKDEFQNYFMPGPNPKSFLFPNLNYIYVLKKN